MIHAIFRGLCPNCGGDITDDRLLAGLPCTNCLPDIKEVSAFMDLFKSSPLDFELKLGEFLEARGKLMGLKDYVNLARKLKDFEEFFSKITGKRMWSAQRTWAKRALSGLSFAIIAPTGVGKTLFAVALTLYYAKQGKKTLFVLPTIVLANQVYEWLKKYAENAMLNLGIIPLFGGHVKDKESAFDAIRKGQVDVVVTTPMSLAKNFNKMLGARFDLVAVDDVDALLRRSRNIDRVLNLMGFPQEDIDLAMRLIRERAKLLGLLRIGRKEKVEEVRAKLNEMSSKLKSSLAGNNYGQLIVLSATGRARGLRVKLFRELLGFEAGTIVEYMRNIQDCHLLVEGDKPEDLMGPVLDLVRKLGSGGLIYVSHDLGADYAQALTEYLVSNGIKAAFAKAGMRGIRKLIEDFARGELEVLVGVASYYGVIVRGLDLPERVRYALFVAVPKFKFTLDSKESHPIRLLQIMSVLQTIVEGDEAYRLARVVADMRRHALRLGYEEARLVTDALRKEVKLEGYLEEVRQLFASARELMNELLKREEVKKKFLESPVIDVREIDGKLYMFIPDVMTYIQASGRTSRMYTGGLTKGLSIVIYLPQDTNALNNLIKQTRIYIDDIQWKPLSEVDLERLMKEIDEDRVRVKKALIGEVEEVKEPVKSALMVVESPTKARTIANFFGRPSRRIIGPLRAFEVFAGNFLLSIIATRGHIYDLVMEDVGRYGVLLLSDRFIPIYGTLKRCKKCGYQFTLDSDVCPRCGSSSIVKSDDVVRALRRIANEVDLAFIATDPDVEGEKIGWDVACTIAPYLNEVRRGVFHEVTRRAIYEALNNPRDISISMVEAQLVRRIEDRWIGFSLSERLWNVFGKKWLAAGRVQTPVLGWIIERCEEWKRNITNYVIVDVEGGFRLYFDVPLSFKEVKELQSKIKESEVIVEDVVLEEVEVNPPPPFTTDELLYIASMKGFTSAETMKIAQELFEMGLITYHRTDSTTVSDVGRAIARDYLQERYGDEYKNWFVPRDWFKEGAHECIRPTRPIDASTLQRLIMDGSITTIVPLTMKHYRLYDLIFKRFIASQMRRALIVRARYKFSLEISGVKYFAEEEGIVEIKDPGFYDVLGYKLLNKLNKGDKCKIENVEIRRTSKVPLYREGDIVRLMRERGIGRPSTYSKIIEGLLRHGYVVKNKWGGLIATAQGKEVYKYLTENFGELVSEETTKELEEKMALIEVGKLDYQRVLKDLADQVNGLLKGVERVELVSK
ncbi:MAG: reverse gyrase [Candidatus Nezhaarchaeota archaeon]|nr:reverse gyrase [Candidatus Nezhaarchaeota archaeon]